MDGGGALVLVWLLAASSAQDPCGPDKLCTCHGTQMDCSRKQFQSICGICNSSFSQNVTQLCVSYNMIQGLEDATCVTGCKRLNSLDLNHNHISAIGADVFETMHGLTYLDVSSNKLSVYTKEGEKVFQHLRQLRTLKINNQRDTSMYAYPDISNLTSLENLHMDGLRDSTFDSSFSKLRKLTGLFMSGQSGKCDLGELHNDSFMNLSHIETLSVSACSISNIDLLTFALPNLRWLDLSYNRRLGFETLHNVSYSLQFTKIETLNYSYVYNTIGPSTSLKKHNICYLWNTTLKHISLDSNRMGMVESNVLILVPPTLQYTSLNYNKLYFESYILQVGCLANVSIYEGSFMGFSDGFSALYFTEPRYPPNRDVFLNSSGCPFMQENFMKNISKHISLITNGCPYIEDSLYPRLCVPVVPKSLQKMQVTDSRIRSVLTTASLPNTSNNVKYLNLSGNSICPWTGPVLSANLKVLDLSRNNCDNIASNFFTTNMKHLEILNVSQNFIGLHSENLKRTFQNLTNLKELVMAANNIAYIPSQAFYGLTSLETLDLSVNLLSDWTLDVQTLTNINTIILKHNFLEALPDYLTSHLVKVSKKFSLDLRNNTLKYHCKYQSFLHWIVEHKGNLVGFDEYVFLDEDGKHITSSDITSRVEQLSTICRNYTVWIVLSSIGVTLCLSVIVGGLVYRKRWKLRYFLYMSKQRFYGYVRVPDDATIENFKFNAFVSYDNENMRFVRDEFIPKVEQNGTSLCVHERDFLPGKNIADNIVDAIQSSRKTVVLLSKAFLKSKWCMYEFNMARMENIYSRDESCLVIVMLEHVPAKDMPLEMMNFLRTETYIEYTCEPEGQLLFWEQLRQAITA